MSATKFNMLITNFCKVNGLELSKEYRFAKPRRWKSDYYIPKLNVLIEYEGLGVGHNKSKSGGHQTVKGYTANCEKYNQANLRGFILLRYTALNFYEVHYDLNYLIYLHNG